MSGIKINRIYEADEAEERKPGTESFELLDDGKGRKMFANKKANVAIIIGFTVIAVIFIGALIIKIML